MVRTTLLRKSGIYQIQSKLTGKIYIGSAINLIHRKNIHFFSLKKQKHHNLYLQRHIIKYGIDDLQFGIIEFCDKDKLIEREQYWIDKIQSEFNIAKVAGSPMLGRKHTEETKLKMSLASKGKPKSEEHIRHFMENNGMLGKHHTEESNKKNREHNLGKNNGFYGKHHTEESLEKMGAATKKRMTNEEKERLSRLMKGRKRIYEENGKFHY